MASSLVESRKKRWQMEATQAHGRDLPPWTRSDDDVTATGEKRRALRRRKTDGPATDPDFKVSLIYKQRRRRAFTIPGGSFRETYDNDNRRVRRSNDEEEDKDEEKDDEDEDEDVDYDMPGNSLRETTVDAKPTQTATSTSRVASRQTTTSETVETTMSEKADAMETTTASGTSTRSSAPTTTQMVAYESASSDSESAGDETAGASEGEDDAMEMGDAVASAAPAVTSSISANQNLMVEDGMHSNVHKILLAVGSVVGFILIASVLLIAWKLRKRNRHRKPKAPLDDGTFQKPSRVDRILAKAPFIRTHFTNRQEWYTIPDPSRVTVEKTRATPTPNVAPRRIDSSVLSFDKPVGLGLYGADFSQSVSTIDTQFIPPGQPTGVYTGTLSRAQSSLSRSRTLTDPVSPIHEPLARTTPASPSRVASVAISPIPDRKSFSRSRANSVAVSPVSTMFVEDTAVQVQVVSRQAPKAIRLSVRQTGASDLSSISSGFGDGDIIITPNNTVTTVNTARLPTPPSPVANPSRGVAASSSRQSSMRSHRTNTGSSLRYDSRASTASTQVSIESRPRFHSVNSWVKQQTGQVRRAQQSNGDTPPVPMLPPPEQELRYMMPDGEEPRHPEAV